MKAILSLVTLGTLALVPATSRAAECQPLANVTLTCTDHFGGQVGHFVVTIQGDNSAYYSNGTAGLTGELTFDPSYRPTTYVGYCRYEGTIGQGGTTLQLLLSPALMSGSAGPIHEISSDLEGSGSSNGECTVEPTYR